MMPILVEHLATGADVRAPRQRGARLGASAPWWPAPAPIAGWPSRPSTVPTGSGSAASSSSAPPPIRRRPSSTRRGRRSASGPRPARPYQAAHLLQRAGVAAAPVQDASDLARDPQLRARGFIVEIDHPDLGRIEYPGAVERTVRPGGGVKGPVPRLGEHTATVLAEWAGIGDPEVDGAGGAGSDLAPGAMSQWRVQLRFVETVSHNTVPSVTAPILRGCRVRAAAKGGRGHECSTKGPRRRRRRQSRGGPPPTGLPAGVAFSRRVAVGRRWPPVAATTARVGSAATTAAGGAATTAASGGATTTAASGGGRHDGGRRPSTRGQRRQ